MLVNEHLPCGDAGFTGLQRVNGLQVAVQGLDGGEVFGVSGTSVGVIVAAAAMWGVFAHRTVDGPKFEELLFCALVLKEHLDGLI